MGTHRRIEPYLTLRATLAVALWWGWQSTGPLLIRSPLIDRRRPIRRIQQIILIPAFL